MEYLACAEPLRRTCLSAAAETLVVYASCSGRHDDGQGNINILQHLESDRRRDGTGTKLFLKFYLNKVSP